jgi:SAM-dependent methyltransferase
MTYTSIFDDPLFWNEQRFQKLEHERAKKMLDTMPSDITSLLDVGCGNGLITNQLNATGLDISRAALTHLHTPAVQGNAIRLPFKTDAFDALVCTEVIEHLSYTDYHAALGELARVAKRYILISVPFMENLRLASTICPQCGCTFHAYHHVRSFDIQILRNLFSSKGNFSLEMVQAILPEKMPIFLGFIRRFILQPFPHYTNCPQCRYYLPKEDHSIINKTKNYMTLASLAKKVWPQTTRPRWWVALYERQ